MTTEIAALNNDIKSLILTIRGVQVMLDRDLAMLYGVTTKRLNEQVKRNLARFPGSFRFLLSSEEMAGLVANCDRFNRCKKEVFWTGASLKDAGRLTFAAAKMGEEIIPGLLESIRKATARRREYDKGKRAVFASGVKASV